jgi:hypothetical protein
MRSARRTSLAVVLAALASCSPKTTEIVVAVATDLPSTEMNRVNLQVHYLRQGVVTGKIEDLAADRQIEVTWRLDRVVTLPATIGLLAGQNLAQRVLISVLGMKEQQEVVRRQALLSFAPERIVVLHLNLLKRCSSPTGCSDTQTCGESGCEPLVKDSSSLPSYTPEEVARHFLDGRVVDQRREGPIDGLADGRSDVPTDVSSKDVVRLTDKMKPTEETKPTDAKPAPDFKQPSDTKPFATPDKKPYPDQRTPDTRPPLDQLTPDGPQLEWIKITIGLPVGNLKAVWGTSDSDFYVVGDTSTCIAHWSAGSWKAPSASCSATLNAVAGTSASDIHTLGNCSGVPSSAKVYALHYTTSWTSVDFVNGGGMYCGAMSGIWAESASGTVVAVGTPGYYSGGSPVYRFTGGAWTAEAVPKATDGGMSMVVLNGVWGSSTSDIWAVGSNGAVRHYNGSKWSIVPQTAAPTAALYGVFGPNATDIIAVGDGTVVQYSGGSWSLPIGANKVGVLRAIHGRQGTGIAFAVGDSGAIVQRLPDGSWAKMPSGVGTTHLKGIWCNPSSNCCHIVGDSATLLRRCMP